MRRLLGLLSLALVAASSWAGVGNQDSQIIIKYLGSDRDAGDLVHKYGDTVVQRIPALKLWVIEVNQDVELSGRIAKYAGADKVAYAEPNGYVHATLIPNDPFWANQWGPPKVEAPKAWDVATGSAGVTIAIIDTGISLAHPDLAANIVAGYDFVNLDNVPDDDNQHGTHCAGIAAGIKNNAVGIAGLASGCKLMPVKVLNAGGSGSWADVAAGIDYASANGAKVLSLSLGGTGGTQALEDAVNLAWSRGCVTVCAAGNNGSSGQFFPAYYTNAIAVASTDPGDTKSSFSNYGTWVDVAAPGSNIYSTLPGNSYGNLSGTSMACPLVAGLAGLLYSQEAPFFSNARVRARIEGSCDFVGNFVIKGRINARRALSFYTAISWR